MESGKRRWLASGLMCLSLAATAAAAALMVLNHVAGSGQPALGNLAPVLVGLVYPAVGRDGDLPAAAERGRLAIVILTATVPSIVARNRKHDVEGPRAVEKAQVAGSQNAEDVAVVGRHSLEHVMNLAAKVALLYKGIVVGQKHERFAESCHEHVADQITIEIDGSSAAWVQMGYRRCLPQRSQGDSEPFEPQGCGW